MFESQRFSGHPGPHLAAALAAVEPDRLDDEQLSGYLTACRRQEAWTASRLAAGIGAFAERHLSPQPQPKRPSMGTPRAVRFGGEGTPLVDEFAAEQLAPVLQVAPMTAGSMLGDVLDLYHRLPWVRTGLRGGSLSWQAARAIAAGTRKLSLPQLEAATVDRRLFFSATRLTPGRLRARIGEVVAHADPDTLDDDADNAGTRTYLGFQPQPHAQVTSIFGDLDPAGALRLDQHTSTVARLLHRLDHHSPWEALRARALTLLADPAGLRRLRRTVAALEHAGMNTGMNTANPTTPTTQPTPTPVATPVATLVAAAHGCRSPWCTYTPTRACGSPVRARSSSKGSAGCR